MVVANALLASAVESSAHMSFGRPTVVVVPLLDDFEDDEPDDGVDEDEQALRATSGSAQRASATSAVRERGVGFFRDMGDPFGFPLHSPDAA